MKKAVSVIAAAAVGIALVATSAYAAKTGEGPATVSAALEHLAIVVLTVLASVLTYLSPGLIRRAKQWFEDKTRIDVPLAVVAQADALALKAIAFAEEQARKGAKGLLGDKRLPGKLESAVRFFITFAEDHGIADWSQARIKDYLESKLHLERARAELVLAHGAPA